MPTLAREDVTDEEVRAYVRAACDAQGLALDDAGLDRVVEVFARNARIAAQVLTFPLPEDQDPAAILRLD